MVNALIAPLCSATYRRPSGPNCNDVGEVSTVLARLLLPNEMAVDAAVPLALRPTVIGELDPVCVIVNDAALAPIFVGVAATVMLYDWPGASVILLVKFSVNSEASVP